MARIFKYQDQVWEDPGEGFSNEDVRKHLTQFFPELAQATINEKTLDDGTVEVRFVKRAGTKGTDEIIALLDGLKPLELPALDVALRLLTTDDFGAEGAGIISQVQGVIDALEQQGRMAKRVVDVCMKMRSCPARRVPHGF